MSTLLEQYCHLTINFYLIPESEMPAVSKLLSVIRQEYQQQLTTYSIVSLPEPPF
ncbi:hypothetical protein [Pantoea agglomerans]|uniref:hypothetical protein n=1 Tax=Enterobacter agglomerans TaxID=549 RepID=UPI001CCFF532|nr:hypothetical protein [Pantoea agglomerans]